MQLLILDGDPMAAASLVNPFHLNAQLDNAVSAMSCAMWLCLDSRRELLPRAVRETHPITQWVSSSARRWNWTRDFVVALTEEYFRHYGKISESESTLDLLGSDMKSLHPPLNMRAGKLEPFYQGVPEVLRVNADASRFGSLDCTVQAYRDFYFGQKFNLIAWEYLGVEIGEEVDAS